MRARHPRRGGRDRAAHGRSRTGALPVLQDLRITRDGRRARARRLRPRDHEPGAGPGRGRGAGVAVVPPRCSARSCASSSAAPVTVAVTGDEAGDHRGRFSTSLRLKPAEDYPRLRVATTARACGSTPPRSPSALRQVVRAASKDDSAADPHRRAAHGARRRAAPGRDRLVPARGARPQGREHARRGPEGARRGQGSRRGAAALAGDGEIEVVLRERDVVFRTSRAEVTARLIEGDFPNYEQLIPSGYPNRLIVSRATRCEARRPGADRRPEPRQRRRCGSR